MSRNPVVAMAMAMAMAIRRAMSLLCIGPQMRRPESSDRSHEVSFMLLPAITQ
jgi:CO dehydrogenase/acetyl-CoA synthase epsilon subunit